MNTGPRQRDKPRKFQWTASEDRTLRLYLREGYTLPVIAARFSCGIPAVQRRIAELGISLSRRLPLGQPAAGPLHDDTAT